MGLKECIHLAFCLCVAMRFHFKLSRGENAVPWLADAVLGCVSEAFSRHTWFIHMGTRRFHLAGLTGEAPSLSHHTESVTSLIRSSIKVGLDWRAAATP